MVKLMVVLAMLLAEDFVDRWPKPVSVDPAPIVEPEKPKARVTHTRKKRSVFVCHRQYYYRHNYRYWRCKR